jgi:hypothetical protein
MSSFVMGFDALDGRVAGWWGCWMVGLPDGRVTGLPGIVILANSNTLDERVAGRRPSNSRDGRVAGYRDPRNGLGCIV